MKYQSKALRSLLLCTVSALLITGCGGGGGSLPGVGSSGGSSGGSSSSSEAGGRKTLTEFPVPEASGTVTFAGDDCGIDASNTDEGYVMVKYTGSADKVKVQIKAPDGATYTYNLAIGDYETFPLSAGDGNYTVSILPHVKDDMYAMALSEDISVTLNDEFRPFLYPNQYVWYTEDYQVPVFGREISDKSSDDLNYVQNVYSYVIGNVTYDKELAANISADYLPNIDRTYESNTGICFDYASMMSALLRSQGIPTKLVVGYSGTAYHAWISVYLDEIGWVDKIIQFDGKSWSLMDPTLAASNDSSAVGQYIGDGSNYTVKYNY